MSSLALAPSWRHHARLNVALIAIDVACWALTGRPWLAWVSTMGE